MEKKAKIMGAIGIIIGLAIVIYGIVCGKEYSPAIIIFGIIIMISFSSLFFESKRFASYVKYHTIEGKKEIAKEIAKAIKEELKDEEK